MATAKATAKKRGRPAKAKPAAAAPASTVKKRGRPAKAKPTAAKVVKAGKSGKPGRPAKAAKPVAKMDKSTMAMDPVVKLKETLAAKSEKDLAKALAKFSASWQKKRGTADAKKIKTAEKKAAVKAKAAAKAAAKRAKKK